MPDSLKFYLQISPDVADLMERRGLNVYDLIRQVDPTKQISVCPTFLPVIEGQLPTRGNVWELLGRAAIIATLVTSADTLVTRSADLLNPPPLKEDFSIQCDLEVYNTRELPDGRKELTLLHSSTVYENKQDVNSGEMTYEFEEDHTVVLRLRIKGEID